MKCSTSNQIKFLIWFQLNLFHFILWYLHSKLRKLGLVFFTAWQQKQSSSDVEVYLNLIQRTAQHLNSGTKFLCKHMGLDIFSRQLSPHLSGSTLWKCIMCFLNISTWVGLGGDPSPHIQGPRLPPSVTSPSSGASEPFTETKMEEENRVVHGRVLIGEA